MCEYQCRPNTVINVVKLLKVGVCAVGLLTKHTHLIVYDLSFGKHYDDADFVYGKAGRSVELIKDYFDNHAGLLDQYDYFFIIDETSTMSAVQINDLFDEMDKEKSEFSLLGMAMPCFRRDLMKQLLSDNPENSALYF